MTNCSVCGRFIDQSWVSEWNYFSFEAAAFCRREDTPLGYRERQDWLLRHT